MPPLSSTPICSVLGPVGAAFIQKFLSPFFSSVLRAQSSSPLIPTLTVFSVAHNQVDIFPSVFRYVFPWHRNSMAKFQPLSFGFVALAKFQPKQLWLCCFSWYLAFISDSHCLLFLCHPDLKISISESAYIFIIWDILLLLNANWEKYAAILFNCTIKA